MLTQFIALQSVVLELGYVSGPGHHEVQSDSCQSFPLPLPLVRQERVATVCSVVRWDGGEDLLSVLTA